MQTLKVMLFLPIIKYKESLNDICSVFFFLFTSIFSSGLHQENKYQQ